MQDDVMNGQTQLVTTQLETTLLETAELEKPNDSKVNLLGLSLDDLCQYFVNLGEKSFRSKQVFKWIHKHGVEQFSEMTDLSKPLREILEKKCEIKAPEIAKEQLSTDGTVKWLLRLTDGNYIETVFIPENDRGTLCVSSQVGCALNCSFCSTAKQGFNRNLTPDEIIGQVYLATKRLHHQTEKRVTNVVMMGMGEPLLNFDAVTTALSIMRHDLAYALPRRRVTLSTAGVVKEIDRLGEVADVSLAISLHAPNNELRNELVPINKKYPIVELMDACKRYVERDHRRLITIEYVMLQGVNDTTKHAKELAKVLQGVQCKVNLIPFNPHPGTEYRRSYSEEIRQFQAIVMRAGFVTTIRKTRGDDIDAACGQLVGKVIDRTSRSKKWKALNLTIKEEESWIEKLA